MLTLSGLHFWWSVVCVVRTDLCALASVDCPLRAGYLLGFDMRHLLLGSNAAVPVGLSVTSLFRCNSTVQYSTVVCSGATVQYSSLFRCNSTVQYSSLFRCNSTVQYSTVQ